MGLFKNEVGRPSNDTKRKRRIFYVAIVGILLLSVAFAALSTQLTINGKANVEASTWNIVFEDLTLKEVKGNAVGNPVGTETADAKIEESNIEINNLNATLKEPKDSVTYTTYIANNGTIDAKVHLKEFTQSETLDQIDITATYEDGTSVSDEIDLGAGEKVKVTITMSYDDITDSSLLVSEDTQVDVSYVLMAEQDVDNN